MNLNPTFIQRIKGQVDLVNIVGQYVRLKRQGSGHRYVGLCPFHSERRPSFGVNRTLRYYKCFGCGAAGDVFAFIQKIENRSFPDTVKLLAAQYGISSEVFEADPAQRFSPELLAEAELFRIGLRWHIEPELAKAKGPILNGGDFDSERIYRLTQLLAQIECWNQRDAARALEDLAWSESQFVADRIHEVKQALLCFASIIAVAGTAEVSA